ncbi:MAG: hypothetical protein MZW92_68760 [Comamonadaceae bacterium]|nr:hypothetical protein [Comamonadaceae bacterium]
MRESKRIGSYIWVVLFIPISGLAAGVLAYVMLLSAPISGGHGFWDVLRGFAPFWPGTYGVRHVPSLILSIAVLLLLAAPQRTRKPIVTLVQIRVILLILLALLTVLTKIFSVLTPMDPATKAAIPLFIYAEMDLFLVFPDDLPALFPKARHSVGAGPIRNNVARSRSCNPTRLSAMLGKRYGRHYGT